MPVIWVTRDFGEATAMCHSHGRHAARARERIGVRWGLLLLLGVCLTVPPVAIAGAYGPAWRELQTGDLVFRAGRGLFSALFRSLGQSDSPYSHVGVVYRRGGSLYVIHAEADDFTGIGSARMDRLADFVSSDNASSYTFRRPKALDAPRRDRLARTLLGYVQEAVPFDTDFDLADDRRLYCSELVYKAFLSVGVELVDRPETVRLPAGAVRSTIEAITIGQLVHSRAVTRLGQAVKTNLHQRRPKQ